MEKDVFIKDEGDVLTIGFVSKQSQELIRKELGGDAETILYGNDVLKIDVDNDDTIEKELITWCVSHNLSVESF